MTNEEFTFKLLSTFTSDDIRELQRREYIDESFFGRVYKILKPLTYNGVDHKAGDIFDMRTSGLL